MEEAGIFFLVDVCLKYSPRNLGMKIQVDFGMLQKITVRGLLKLNQTSKFYNINKTCLMFFETQVGTCVGRLRYNPHAT